MHFEDDEPDRLYFSIKELSKEFAVNASALRFWEKEFKQLKPKKNKKGDRFYTKEDIAMVRYIHYLLKEKGYTLDGARKILAVNQGKPDQTYKLIERLQKVRFFLGELRQQL